MLTFKSFASGSSGNLYTVDDGKTKIMIDCGLPFKKIQQKLKFKISGISACLISHSHQDHCRAVESLAAFGVDIYSSEGTIQACSLQGHRIHTLTALQEIEIGSFKVLPFDVAHDAPMPLGFLLTSNESGEKLLFFTDTFYLKYRFNGLTIIAAEANYDRESLQYAINAGYVPEIVAKRVFKSHMSLEHLIEMLKANDLSQVKQIYLMHLSSNNSNEKYFKTEIQKATGAEVYVC